MAAFLTAIVQQTVLADAFMFGLLIWSADARKTVGEIHTTAVKNPPFDMT